MPDIYIIKNPQSGLVLEAAEDQIKSKEYNASNVQHWTLEDAGNGKFFIVNVCKGKVIDLASWDGTKVPTLIVYKKHGGKNQQWSINSDGTIVCQNSAIDLISDKTLIAWPKNGGHNKKFKLEIVNICNDEC